MYPKKFTVDPIAIARARLVTLRAPNLNILRPENGVVMPGIAHFLEGGFKARDKEGKLLLPDLSALCNTTVGIFSDYAGESTGKYYTYSFLVCAFGSLGPFTEQMSALRIKYDLPKKEIAFKDFRMGPLRRMLPAYLRLVDQFVSGLVFTLVVEKNIPSLFGPGLEVRQKLITALEKEGYGPATPKVAEKLFRITHIVAFLVALLGRQGQKIFWMTDHDAIGATPAKHTRLLSILTKVMPLYTSKSFSFLGGAQPFEPRALEYLDLLSLADVSGGSIAEILTNIDDVGHEKAHIKEGGQHVLRWLCHDSVTLKKFSMIVRHDANRVVGYGTLNFAASTPIPDEIFIPTQLLR